MKAKFSVYLMFSLLITFKTQAQTPSSSTNVARLSKNDWGSILRGNQPLMTKKKDDVELRGTPFYKDEWESGSVVLFDSTFTDDPNLKFKLDLETYEIWILANKEEKILTDSRIMGLDLDIGIKILKFRRMKIPDLKKEEIPFVKVLFEGTQLKLYKYIKKQFLEANAVDKGIVVTGRDYDSYETIIDYYAINERRQVRKIGLKRGELYKTQPTLVEKNRDAIKKFCDDNDISSSLNEKELVQLVTYLETLK
jgi:hypothetical protein